MTIKPLMLVLSLSATWSHLLLCVTVMQEALCAFLNGQKEITASTLLHG